MRRSAWIWLGILSCAACLATGCGSSSSGSLTNAQVRFVMASPDAPQVNILVDGVVQAGDLSYGNASTYISVTPKSHTIQAAPVSGGAAIFDQNITFASSSNQTLLLTGPAASIQSVMLDDTSPTVVVGDAFVRVVNASATMGAADVYIVPAGSGIAGVMPVTAGLAFEQNTGYQLTVAGNYQVFMTTPKTSNALLNTGPISLVASQNQTVVVLDGAAAGTFTFAPLPDQ